MIISPTEIGNYNRCNRLWGITSFNQQSLTRITHSTALSLGTLWHQTQAAWLLAPEQDPTILCAHYYQTMRNDAIAAYKQRVGTAPWDSELQPIEDAGNLCIQMVDNYAKYYKTPLPEGFRCIRPEQTILVPIPNSEQECLICNGGKWDYEKEEDCKECDGNGYVSHQLECTLDGLLANERNRLYILERKTYGARPKEESLHHNFQFLCYQWATTTLGLGTVGGLLYDGAWKRAQPPKGRTFDDLFLRLHLERPIEELLELEKYLALKSKQMYETARLGNPLLDYNRRWEGCYDCGVEDLCTTISRGEDTEYVRNKFFTIRERTPAFRKDEED